MNNIKWKWFAIGLALGLLFTIFVAKAFAAINYPDYHNYINDFANVVDDKKEAELNKQLSAFDKRTTNQIAVAVVDTIGDESVEDYAVHLFDKWGPGVKGKDNGVLIVFAMKEHKDRIEVGRGLEGDLTDIEAKHILDDDVQPKMKAGDYTGGVSIAVADVLRAIDPTATEAGQVAPETSDNPGDIAFGVIIFLVILFIIIIVIIAVVADGGDDGDGFGGGLLGGVVGGAIGSALGGDSDGDSDGGSFGGGI